MILLQSGGWVLIIKPDVLGGSDGVRSSGGQVSGQVTPHGTCLGNLQQIYSC